MVKNKTRGFQWRDVEESEIETMSKFELGQVVMTRTINETIAQNEQFAIDVVNAMAQYRNCDWGVTCEEDAEMNDNAVEYGDDRIFASYDTCEGNIWIITEWDRSATTILFSQEY